MDLFRISIIAALTSLSIILSSGGLAADKPHRLLVLLSDDEPAYLQTFDSFQSALQRTAGPGIPFEIERATLRNGTSDSAMDGFQRADLIIPVGARAARFARQNTSETPVLNILITREAYYSIWSPPATDQPARVSALFLEQPFDRQFRLIRLGLPAVRRCGILVGDRYLDLQPELRAAAARSDIELHIVEYSASRPVEAFREVLETSDAVLVLPDSEVITPHQAKWLLYMAYQQQTPIVGFSQAIVEAGALTAVFTTPAQAGREAADQVFDLAVEMHASSDNTWRLPPPRYPDYFQIAVNNAVARALDVETGNDRQLTHALRTFEQSERWQAGP